jgi:hypothetical protein
LTPTRPATSPTNSPKPPPDLNRIDGTLLSL